MIWAAAYLPVPRWWPSRSSGHHGPAHRGLRGRDATDPVWHDDLPALVRALGQGLRRFHEAVGEEWCPFRFDLDRSLDHVARRVEVAPLPADSTTSMPASPPRTPLTRLRHRGPTTRTWSSATATIAAERAPRGWSGHGYVDLGELGVADRWWDVAVGAWSAGWNFGEEHEVRFYEGYGIEPDPERIRFYRLLYDVVS